MTFSTLGFVLYSVAVYTVGYGIGYWAKGHCDAYQRNRRI